MKYQTNKPCTACGIETENGNCLHHVKTRKSGGTDDDWNLMPLCLKHHNMIHNCGTVYMSDKFTRVKWWLHKNGWNYEMGNWVNINA